MILNSNKHFVLAAGFVVLLHPSFGTATNLRGLSNVVDEIVHPIDSTVYCTPHDATGLGMCTGIIGVKWDGQQCVPVQGCTCVGDDCDTISGMEMEDCKDEFLRSCIANDGSRHLLLPRETEYAAEQNHNMAACGGEQGQDAYQVSDSICRSEFGYKWDGTECTLVECECEGSDCDAIEGRTKEECEQECGISPTNGVVHRFLGCYPFFNDCSDWIFHWRRNLKQATELQESGKVNDGNGIGSVVRRYLGWCPSWDCS